MGAEAPEVLRGDLGAEAPGLLKVLIGVIKMEVLIFAGGEVSKKLNKILNENGKHQPVASIQKVLDLARALEKYKKMVVIVDLTESPMLLEQLIPFIKARHMKTLAICRNIKEGFNSLGRGADDILTMPADMTDFKAFGNHLVAKVNKLYQEYDLNPRVLKNDFKKKITKMIAIGSSTGGTEVVLGILKSLPEDSPPILVVQHMPAVFTNMYSKRLHSECKISAWEAQDGDELKHGLCLIAPGEHQMRLDFKNDKYIVSCIKGEPVGGHMPSVDVLFESVAKYAGKNAIGIILTGMGADGAQGLLKMKQRGAFTIGQDESSSVVYGMPKVAHEIGAAAVMADPKKITEIIIEKISEKQ